MKPQRFGVVDGGLGPDQITFFVVLLDGISPEPVFDAGVVVIQSPEGFGICAGRPKYCTASLSSLFLETHHFIYKINVLQDNHCNGIVAQYCNAFIIFQFLQRFNAIL